MMAWQMETARNPYQEHAVPLPSEPETDTSETHIERGYDRFDSPYPSFETYPADDLEQYMSDSQERTSDPYERFREESGDAYALVQHKIIEFAEYQKQALASNDKAVQGNALFLRQSVKDTIKFNLEHGYLNAGQLTYNYENAPQGIEQDREQVLDFLANDYLHLSLDLYEKYGADPAISLDEATPVPQEKPALEESVAAAARGMDMPLFEGDTIPAHISTMEASQLSAEDKATKQSFDTLLADGFEKLKKQMKKFGKKTIDVLYHSGEIPLPPTKVLPTIDTENELQETK